MIHQIADWLLQLPIVLLVLLGGYAASPVLSDISDACRKRRNRR